MADRADRSITILIPDWEHGDFDAVRKWLGLERSALQHLIDTGAFPPAAVVNRNNVLWDWRTVVASSWLLRWLGELRERHQADQKVPPGSGPGAAGPG